MSSAKTVTCPVPGCGKIYQDWNGLRSVEQLERSFRSHLTGKHCLKGDAYRKAYSESMRFGYIICIGGSAVKK